MSLKLKSAINNLQVLRSSGSNARCAANVTSFLLKLAVRISLRCSSVTSLYPDVGGNLFEGSEGYFRSIFIECHIILYNY